MVFGVCRPRKGDIERVWDQRFIQRRDQPALYEQVQEREAATNYALECRLANQIVRGEELKRRLSLLDYHLDQDLHNLWQACRWADRIELCRTRLEKDKKEIHANWLAIWRRVARSYIAGEEVSALDAFFFQAWPYVDRVLAGEIAFAELDAGYDWDKGCFRRKF